MDDFEAFREKRRKEKEKEQEAEKAQAAQDELGWEEGLGPQGPTNPKVKGFVLGRYWYKKTDPSQLEKPKGFQKTRLTEEPPPTDREPTPEEELKQFPKPKGMRKY